MLLNCPNICYINSKHQNQDSGYPSNGRDRCDWEQVLGVFSCVGNVLFPKLGDGDNTRVFVSLLFIPFREVVNISYWKKNVGGAQKMGEGCSRSQALGPKEADDMRKAGVVEEASSPWGRGRCREEAGKAGGTFRSFSRVWFLTKAEGSPWAATWMLSLVAVWRMVGISDCDWKPPSSWPPRCLSLPRLLPALVC